MGWVEQAHCGAGPVDLHGVSRGMGNACGKSCGIDVFSNKLAETLVAVVTLGWVGWLGGVATPQDLEGVKSRVVV